MLLKQSVKITMGMCGLLAAFQLMAEPIVESRTGQPQVRSSQERSYSTAQSSQQRQSSSNAGSNTEQVTPFTLSRMEALEQEVRELRGQVELQDHEIKRLTKSQQDLFLDLERRLNQQKGGVNPNAKSKPNDVNQTTQRPKTEGKSKPAPGMMPSGTEPATTPTVDDSIIVDPDVLSSETTSSLGSEATSDRNVKLYTPQTEAEILADNISIDSTIDTTTEIPDNTATVTPKKVQTAPNPIKGTAAEKGIYESAYNLVLNKRYQEAVPALQEFLEQYPKGQYTPNAHYWLGEVYMLQWRAEKNPDLLNKASTQFTQITNQFPNHQKAMDALLKLGLLENDRGNIEAARKYLTTVKERYPGTSVARVATTHLQRMK